MRVLSVMSLVLLVACSSPEPSGEPAADATARRAPEPVVPTGKVFVDDVDGKLDLAGLTPPDNERTRLLMEGYWEVIRAMNSANDPRYVDHEGHFFRLLPNGNYVYYKPDGSVLHEGWWHYVRRGNRQHYIMFDALDNVHDNEYRFHIQPRAAVLMGTERFNNPGIQLRIDMSPEPPVPVR